MREDCIFSFEEMRLAVNVAERVKRGEERVFTFEESMADLEQGHRMDAASYGVEPLMPISDHERPERITRLRNAMQRAKVKLEPGTVEAMTAQEIQKEIDTWRSERSEKAMASILRGPLAGATGVIKPSESTSNEQYAWTFRRVRPQGKPLNRAYRGSGAFD